MKQKTAFLESGEKYARAGKYQEAVIQFKNAIQVDPRFADAHRQLAEVYLKLKSAQQAYSELLTTVDLDPGNATSQLKLATLLLGAHKYDDAEKAAENALATDPRNARAHVVLGEKHAAMKAWPRAIREFQKAIELDPADVENYAAVGVAYVAKGRTADAETALRKATELQPRSIMAFVNLGRFYYTQHRMPEAEAAMRAAGKADPHATLPWTLLAKIEIETGNLAEAERICADLKSRAPNNPEAYGALASFYEVTGNKEKAASELRALIAAKPKDGPIVARLTNVLIDLNRIDEAALLNQQALRVNPGNPEALVAKGRILITQQKYADAKTAFDQVVKSDPQSAAGHYYLGLAESSLGLSDMAKGSFASALALSPGMADAAVALADLDVRSGDYENGLRLSNQVLQKNPESTRAYVVAARAWLAKGNAAQAETLLRSALDRDPLFLPALESLLNIENSQGKGQEAIHRILTLVTQHPGNARLHFLLGLGYFQQKDLDKSEASIQQAIAIDRKMPDAYGLLGEINRARGNLEQSVRWYKAAIEESPTKAENHMALAGIYEKQGKWEDAKRSAERAHSLDPGSPFIANNLAYLYLEHGGDLNVALSLAQQAKQKLADSPVVADTMGWLYYKLRIPQAAVTQLTESVQRAPANPVYRYHLGMAYIAAGRHGEGASSLRQALTNPNFPEAADAKTALDQLAKGSL